jgi:parallel beta-helix repeat protein
LKKTAYGVMLTLLLVSMLTFVFKIELAKAAPGTIRIKADGSIEPSTANISTSDFVTYAFSGNNNDSIWVERSNVTIDGKGLMLRGSGNGYGFNLSSVDGVTIKNININGFQTGIFLFTSSYNFIFGNNITKNNSFGVVVSQLSYHNVITKNNIVENKMNGIYLYGSSNNHVTRNDIENNSYAGIYLAHSSSNYITSNNVTANNYCGIGLTASSSNNIVSGNCVAENNQSGVYVSSASNNELYHNDFIGNNKSVYIDHYSFMPNSSDSWDNNVEGNYWSDYSGTYNLTTGVGLTPYIIDMANQDNYPLRKPCISGDYNHDGIVNMTDVELLKVAWQSSIGDLNYNPHTDFNMEGLIDIKDASIIGVNWLKHT